MVALKISDQTRIDFDSIFSDAFESLLDKWVDTVLSGKKEKAESWIRIIRAVPKERRSGKVQRVTRFSDGTCHTDYIGQENAKNMTQYLRSNEKRGVRIERTYLDK